MLYSQIHEGAVSDIQALTLAKQWETAFIDWMEKNNTDKTLNENHLRTSKHRVDAGVLNLVDLPSLSGLPDDLTVSIGWFDQLTDSRGYLLVMLDTELRPPLRFYKLVLVARGNPLDQTDVMWGLAMPSFAHEAVHYFDHKKGYTDAIMRKRAQQMFSKQKDAKPDKKETPQQYYNSTLEINAHFQQAVADMLRSLSAGMASHNHYSAKDEEDDEDRLDNFDKFKEFFVRTSDRLKDQFLRYLSPSNKKRIMTRLYQIYVLIKDKWPDIPLVQGEAARLMANWKARDEAEKT